MARNFHGGSASKVRVEFGMANMEKVTHITSATADGWMMEKKRLCYVVVLPRMLLRTCEASYHVKKKKKTLGFQLHNIWPNYNISPTWISLK